MSPQDTPGIEVCRAPDLVQERMVSNQSAAVSRERTEDPELCWGEMNLALVSVYGLVAKVDSQPIQVEDRFAANGFRTAEDGTETGHQFARRKWLWHEVVRT